MTAIAGSPAAAVRSWLFVPADDESKLRKAHRAGAGVVIADLEDAVAPARKAAARESAARFLGEPGAESPLRIVRINDPTLELGRADLGALGSLDEVIAMAPKATLESIEIALRDVSSVVALVETPRGVLELEQIAQTPGVIAVALGTVDLAAELDLRSLPDDLELLYVRSRLAVACAAAGVPAIDGAHLDINDERGLMEASKRARALGLGGKLCIHPAQIATIERAFSPTTEEVERARRMLDAYEDALQDGHGATTLAGEMIDVATVRAARAIIGRASAVDEARRTVGDASQAPDDDASRMPNGGLDSGAAP